VKARKCHDLLPFGGLPYVDRFKFDQAQNETQYLPLSPNLVAEVLSPSGRFSRVESEAFTWLDAGCKLVLLVVPENETIHAYRSRKKIEVFQASETIDCKDAVSDWALKVEDIFRLY
jgi:Uma2 family endonuclease